MKKNFQVNIYIPNKYQCFADLSRDKNHWGEWLDAVERLVGHRIEREGLAFIRNDFLRGDSALKSALTLQLAGIREYYRSINFEFSDEKIWDFTPEIMELLFAGKTIEEAAESLKGKVAAIKISMLFYCALLGCITGLILIKALV